MDIADTSTTLATSLNPAPAGAPLTLTAQVSGNGGTPTGAVTFRDSGAVLSTINLTGSTAALTLATLAPGIHQLSASYTGDAFDAPSTSAALAQQVARQTVITLTSSANPSLLTDSITLTLAAANGTSTPPTGALVLTDGNRALATLPLANGAATYTFAAPALGSHTFIATYAGDPANGPAASQSLVQTVTLRPSTTSFTASSTALSAGQQLILISVVAGQGSTLPSGSVSFTSGSQTLGTAPITAGGIATLTLSPASGLYSASAVYSGDALYAPSTSPAITINVGPPIAFTLTPQPAVHHLAVRRPHHLRPRPSPPTPTSPTPSPSVAPACPPSPPAPSRKTRSPSATAYRNRLPSSSTPATHSAPEPPQPFSPASLNRQNPLTFCMLPAMIFLALFHPRKRKAPQSGTLLCRPSPFRPFGGPLPRRFLTVLLLSLAALGAITGCGTSFTQKATPAGAYTFQIVATGNKTAATETATIQLTVTQ